MDEKLNMTQISNISQQLNTGLDIGMEKKWFATFLIFHSADTDDHRSKVRKLNISVDCSFS